MATKNIGYIADLTGSAQVRTAEGVIKVLNIGDTVSDRDLLITGQGANVTVDFYSGQKLQVTENTEVLLDETVYSEDLSYTDAQVDQVAALQQAILEGKDLSELDPTAAGNEQGQSSSLNETPIYEREAREGEVETRVTDFNTGNASGANNLFANDDALLATAAETPAPTVTVPVSNSTPSLNVQSTANVAEDGSVSITYAAADVDGTIASTVATVDPTQGTVVVNADNTITFTAATNFNGDATVTVASPLKLVAAVKVMLLSAFTTTVPSKGSTVATVDTIVPSTSAAA